MILTANLLYCPRYKLSSGHGTMVPKGRKVRTTGIGEMGSTSKFKQARGRTRRHLGTSDQRDRERNPEVAPRLAGPPVTPQSWHHASSSPGVAPPSEPRAEERVGK